jgi:hypothetical protein
MALETQLLQYLRANSDVYTGWQWYAGGPWWPDDYPLQIEPEASGVDTVQMDAMEPLLAEEGTVQQHYTETGVALGMPACYTVRAVDQSGAESADSNVLQVLLGTVPDPPPPAPTDLSISGARSGLFRSR